MYTIGQVSEMFNIPVSTLRYYDKEGLFPHLQRSGNQRRFSDAELELLHVIDCLKKSGLEIKDIKQFAAWLKEGPATYPQRKELFETRKAMVENEIAQLQRTLAMLEFKCWYYDVAIADGNEDRLDAMIPNNLPAGIQELFDKAHE